MSAPWSETEIETLLELTPKKPPVAIAVKLKRPVKSVLRKQYRLGLIEHERIL
jgi:hypothetical protein